MPGGKPFEVQLHMWSVARQAILERHDFYVEQVKKRVLSQFSDIEGEADRFGDAEYERMGSLPGGEDSDMGDVAEQAMDNAISHYMLLSDMKRQMFLGALAGLYHQWDKDLRQFIEQELRHDATEESAIGVAWDPNIGNVFNTLRDFGWNCRTESFFPLIDACRLIVNVYKHGKGRSLDELAATFPQYLPPPLPTEGLSSARLDDTRNHERLAVTEEQFDEIASALRMFWKAFPERLHLTVG